MYSKRVIPEYLWCLRFRGTLSILNKTGKIQWDIQKQSGKIYLCYQNIAPIILNIKEDIYMYQIIDAIKIKSAYIESK